MTGWSCLHALKTFRKEMHVIKQDTGIIYYACLVLASYRYSIFVNYCACEKGNWKPVWLLLVQLSK